MARKKKIIKKKEGVSSPYDEGDKEIKPEIIEVGVSSPSDDGGVSVKKGLFILCFD